MQNKRIAIMALFLAAATAVFAQENTSSEPPSKSEVQTEHQTSDSKSDNTNTERMAIPGSEPLDGPTQEEPTPSKVETAVARPQSDGDDYRPSRRISGDRSVKFPVDI